MHNKHMAPLWARRQRWPAVWGALLGEQAMHVVRLSRQPGARHLRVQAFEQAQAEPAPHGPHHDTPWWGPRLQSLARPASSLGLGWRWPWARPGPLALAWPQARCQQGVLLWPGAADAPALQAEVHLEAATVLGLPPAEVLFDFQTHTTTHGHTHGPMRESRAPVAPPMHPPASSTTPAPEDGPALLSVHWVAAPREPVLSTQRQLRAAGWRVPQIEPETLAARRAAECLLGEPGLPWAVPVRDWQFAQRTQRSVSEAAWRALQDSPHWGPLAACGAALAVWA